MRFNRKRRYTYYSPYSKPRRARIRWDKVAIIIGIFVVIVGIVVWLNFSRLQLMMKGYSFAQQNKILSLDGDAVDEILDHEKISHISKWIEKSENYQFYDEYEQYYKLHKKDDVDTIIETVDNIFGQYTPKLEAMGYTNKQIWEMLKTASETDLQYLIKKQYTYDQIKPYMQVNGFIFTDIEDYMKAYAKNANYNYAVLITSYPFIDSRNAVKKEYTIKNPDNILTLVKPGFTLIASYEPSDLVDLGSDTHLLVAPDCENSKMRKEAASALKNMFEDAKKEGYSLVVNSAYRSYAKQQETYRNYEQKWGGIYAKEHVANPGASEHQTGLGVDLTSQSVVSGQRLVFGDTDEYKWVLKNAYKYGYILRFSEGEAAITGIVHEPWHFRYVGKDAAKIIYDNDWTLEEYCLNNGIIPEIEEKK